MCAPKVSWETSCRFRGACNIAVPRDLCVCGVSAIWQCHKCYMYVEFQQFGSATSVMCEVPAIWQCHKCYVWGSCNMVVPQVLCVCGVSAIWQCHKCYMCVEFLQYERATRFICQVSAM